MSFSVRHLQMLSWDPYLIDSCRGFYDTRTISVHNLIYTELECVIGLTQFVVKNNRLERIFTKSKAYFALQNLVFYVVGQMRANVQLCKEF